MNLREGLRRLALLLGAAGAIGGGLASYTEFHTIARQRGEHERFEQLANSPVVLRQRETEKRDDRRITNPPITDSNGWQVTVDAGGIRTIFWGSDYAVASIETEGGQLLYPTPSPSAWQYLFVALLPILGFIVPWGVIRAIGWMLVGFVAPSW